MGIRQGNGAIRGSIGACPGGLDMISRGVYGDVNRSGASHAPGTEERARVPDLFFVANKRAREIGLDRQDSRVYIILI